MTVAIKAHEAILHVVGVREAFRTAHACFGNCGAYTRHHAISPQSHDDGSEKRLRIPTAGEYCTHQRASERRRNVLGLSLHGGFVEHPPRGGRGYPWNRVEPEIFPVLADTTRYRADSVLEPEANR